MKSGSHLFKQRLSVINLGTSTFAEDLQRQGVTTTQVDWQPPAGGDLVLMEALDNVMNEERVRQANEKALEVILAANPVLIDMDLAKNVIPGMTPQTILHSGPPLQWTDMCGPMKGAVIGALMFEGMATDADEAKELAASGKIRFSPCHNHGAVGPMAGVISASMPVSVVENRGFGNRSFCTVNEGLGKVLRFGSYDREVIDRLKWIAEELFPAMRAILTLSGGIDLKNIIAQALHMGDECHNRNKAGTSLFVRAVAPYLLQSDVPRQVAARVLEFIRDNDHYFLNLSMPACKASLDAANGIPFSSIVTAMARNGVEFGIRISGASENQWFTGPAQMLEGLLFPGFQDANANPDLGDSAITETMGLGGFAMAGSPAIVQFVGGSIDDAVAYTTKMYDVTWKEHPGFSIPTLNFRGNPVGIDVCKVVQTGELPIINSGIAHKEAGIGQIGAGLVHPPMTCFNQALTYLAEQVTKAERGAVLE